MKKNFAVFISTICLVSLFLSACGTGGAPGSQDGSGNAAVQTVTENTDLHKWIINVSDSKKGTYTVPESGRSFDYTAALNLIAWKNGGDDIFGDYRGKWLISFDVDYDKLSDSDVKFAGNVLVDRLCNDMSFTISPYNSDGYKKIKKSMPGSVYVVPLVKYDGMSSFTAEEIPVKREDWQATDAKSGETLFNADFSFSDGEKVPVGVNMLIRKKEVVADIPTYSSVWKLDYFYGSITENTDGKDPEALFNNIISSRAQKMQGENNGSNPGKGDNESGTGTGSYTTDSEGRKGFDADGDGETDTWYDEDGNMQSDAIQGGYVTDSEGHEGLDVDGDGKLDMWMDEDGDTHMDINKDGKLEIIRGEYSDGAGDGE